jgi:hypothetical protein
MKYNITLTATAQVRTSVEIEADTKAEAKQKAIDFAESGDASWTYDGLDAGTVEVPEIIPEYIPFKLQRRRFDEDEITPWLLDFKFESKDPDVLHGIYLMRCDVSQKEDVSQLIEKTIADWDGVNPDDWGVPDIVEVLNRNGYNCEPITGQRVNV